MRRLAIWAATIALFPGLAVAATGWTAYSNIRFGYSIEVPPGFEALRESDNGDGGISHSADENSKLSVWGSDLAEQTLAQDVSKRVSTAVSGGWDIAYKKVTRKWASWSGLAEGRIFYSRAILVCGGDRAAYFQLEYPASMRAAFDPVVEHLVKSLQPAKCL